MRIALRTGAGRGAYELAGSQGSIKASELFGKEMFYELMPNLIVPGRAVPSVRQGKPRINLDNQSNTTHLYRLLAGLLLLPKPKREFKTTLGDVLIAFEAYSMTAIKIDVGAVETNRSIVRPTELLLENCQGLRKSLNFINRMARIVEIWRVTDGQDSDLAHLLRRHKETLYVEEINHKDVEKSAKDIFTYLNTIYDPLQQIESLIGIEQSTELEEFSPVTSTGEFGIDDTTSPVVARIENVRRWRKVAVRGAAAVQFRAEIETVNYFV